MSNHDKPVLRSVPDRRQKYSSKFLTGRRTLLRRIDVGEVRPNQRIYLASRRQDISLDRMAVDCQQNRIRLIKRILKNEFVFSEGMLQLGKVDGEGIGTYRCPI